MFDKVLNSGTCKSPKAGAQQAVYDCTHFCEPSAVVDGIAADVSALVAREEEGLAAPCSWPVPLRARACKPKRPSCVGLHTVRPTGLCCVYCESRTNIRKYARCERG